MNTKGTAQRKNLWYPGTTITVKFLGNPNATFMDKVKQYASEWSRYADISFDFVASGDADVRVGFDWDSRYVTWAYTGTDCKKVSNQNEATVNFADWSYLSEEELKGDVLRVFGQVLGLELEHRHLESGVEWRRDMKTYWQNELGDIAWNELSKYVFDPLDNIPTNGLISTPAYDETSIMVWPFPRNHTNGISNYANYVLSALDIELIGKIYPIEEKAIVVMKTSQKFVEFKILLVEDILVDWGDGSELEIVKTTDPNYLPHEYSSDQKEHTVRFYGSKEAIEELHFPNSVSYFDVSNNEGLLALGCSGSNITELDVSNHKKLERLFCSNNVIKDLDLSMNSKLTDLECGDNLLTKLDLTNNIEINNIRCHNNPFLANQTTAVAFAHSIHSNRGEVYMYLGGHISWIQDILSAKNWTIREQPSPN